MSRECVDLLSPQSEVMRTHDIEDHSLELDETFAAAINFPYR